MSDRGSTARLPSFFLAGAPGGGTTSLYHYLAQHPKIFMSPIKEPTYFGAADLRGGPHRDRFLRHLAGQQDHLRVYLDGPRPPGAMLLVLDWDDYVSLFSGVRGETAIGEASVSYFWLPSAVPAIRARLPHARLIYVLRNPVDRLFSSFSRSSWRAPQRTFRERFRAAQSTDDPWSLRLEVGRYATHLERVFSCFPREQVRVHLYEEYRGDPHRVLRDLFAFLDVDPTHPVNMTRRHNETKAPRFPKLHALRRRVFGGGSLTTWLPSPVRRAAVWIYHRDTDERAMNADDRQLVVDYYREEILRAGDLIGRDLSSWLR